MFWDDGSGWDRQARTKEVQIRVSRLHAPTTSLSGPVAQVLSTSGCSVFPYNFPVK